MQHAPFRHKKTTLRSMKTAPCTSWRCATDWCTVKTVLTKCTRTAWNSSVLTVIHCCNISCTTNTSHKRGKAWRHSMVGMKNMLFLIFNFEEYIRCGNDSGQCLRVIDRCNNIVDCINGWDEDINTCYSETEQSFFVHNSKSKVTFWL